MNMVFVAYGAPYPAAIFVPVTGGQVFQNGKERGGKGQKMFPGGAVSYSIKFVNCAAGKVMGVGLQRHKLPGANGVHRHDFYKGLTWLDRAVIMQHHRGCRTEQDIRERSGMHVQACVTHQRAMP